MSGGSGTGTPVTPVTNAGTRDRCRIVTPPSSFPVTLAEAKEWCRVDTGDTSQDGALNILIAAMTDYAEHLTGRSFVPRTYELNLDAFAGQIKLPFPPLLSVSSIAYTDINGDAQTVAGSAYESDVVSQPGIVQPVWGQSWPSIGYGLNPVRIQYQAGYTENGVDNSYLPGPLRMWLQARLATIFENREQLVFNNQVEIPRNFADGALDPLIVGTRLF